MATRPTEHLKNSIIKEYTASGAVTKSHPVRPGASSDTTVRAGAAVGDNFRGVALNDAVDGGKVRVALFGEGVVPMVLGVGGATRGDFLEWSAAGGIAVTHGVATATFLLGEVMESGVAGDLVGVNIGLAGRGTKA